MVLNFESFADIVDALGGVDMYFPTQVKDMDSLYQTKTGCQHIGGFEALALVRARHLYYGFDRKTKTWLGYDGSGDLGRIVRDHLFLQVLASTVKKQGLSNPLTDESLLGAVAPFLTVDTTFGDGEMLSLIRTFHSVGVSSVPEYTAPIIEDTQTYMYKGYDYGDVVFPTEPQDLQTISAFMGKIPAGLKLHPDRITVSVVDGTGSASATAAVVGRLHALGYHVVATGSQTPVGPISETTVEYPSGAHLNQAEKVLSDLSGTVAMAHRATLGHADVTIVTGSDLAVTSATPVHSSPPVKSSSTTSTGSPPRPPRSRRRRARTGVRSPHRRRRRARPPLRPEGLPDDHQVAPPLSGLGRAPGVRRRPAAGRVPAVRIRGRRPGSGQRHAVATTRSRPADLDGPCPPSRRVAYRAVYSPRNGSRGVRRRRRRKRLRG